MKHTDPSEFNLLPAAVLPTQSVLGLDLVDATPAQAARALLTPTRKTAFFYNAHCDNLRVTTPTYAMALARADYILPDGIGVELAAKLEGKRLTSNLNGTDFVPELLAQAAADGKSVYLLGGRPGTAEAAAQRLCMSIPGLRIAGSRDGYEGMRRTAEVIDDINSSGADILLVALGVPLQELWIDTNRAALAPGLVMGVGALFDFQAGNVRRAPKLLRKARLEWGWRLAMEPRRMAKRYLLGNATFMIRAARFAAAQKTARKAPFGQRALDVALSVTALTVLGLPMLAIAAAIRLDSRGPALFAQTRIGKNGVPFKVLKFRSMHTDAEARRAALLSLSDRDGICFKSRNDPRVTRIGRLLRRTSLDELPQIINVLKGQMSIVGPRPALPEEVAQYPGHALGRLAVNPGITGLWQVSGRANIGFDKMVDLDLAYARTRSVWLDMLLIALTFRAVLSGRGAY